MAKKRKMKKKRLFSVIIVIIIGVVFFMLAKTIFNRPENKKEAEVPKTEFVNRISYNNSVKKKINSKAEKVIVAFMNIYYRSMKELKEYDVTSLFASDAYENAQIVQTALSLLVDIRALQTNDLAISDCSYDIEYYSVKEENGNLVVSYYEDNIIKFNFMEDTASNSYDIKNTITLKEESGNYKIVAYEKVDDFFNMVTEDYEKDNKDKEEVKMELTKVKTDILKQVQVQLANVNKEYTAYVNGEVDNSPTCDNPYDRGKAAAYAKKWVNARNANEWFSYDGLGGNCNNYASQAILAGGVPMDTTGHITEQWKHYNGVVNEKPEAVGRSYSWTGVNQFYQYASTNKGYGMCAKVDVNIYLAEPGDIIQVGAGDAWVHTVIVIDVIKKDDKVVDILINSNSIDRESYPLSAYNYANKRLIKIYGWNN